MLVNLTPHALVVRLSDDQEITLPPSGAVARVSTTQEVVRQLNGVDIVHTVFGEVSGLPETDGETTFAVSSLVLSALKAAGIDRDDVVAPDTGPTAIRENGQIVAVRRFQVL